MKLTASINYSWPSIIIATAKTTTLIDKYNNLKKSINIIIEKWIKFSHKKHIAVKTTWYRKTCNLFIYIHLLLYSLNCVLSIVTPFIYCNLNKSAIFKTTFTYLLNIICPIPIISQSHPIYPPSRITPRAPIMHLAPMHLTHTHTHTHPPPKKRSRRA